MFPAVTDPTGNITEQDLMHIQLEAGYYLVSYSVSAIFNDPSYMQVTPFIMEEPILKQASILPQLRMAPLLADLHILFWLQRRLPHFL